MAALNRRLSSLIAATALVAGCGKGGAPQQQMQMPPAEVGVITVNAQTVPLTRDLVGRLSATRTADVRARVAGVLLKRAYTEGSDVKDGQLLFQIDPAPLQAALNAQLANLAAAQATAQNNHIAAERARSIADKGLISKSDRDNADAAERTSAAAVKQAEANVQLARINLGYATVTSPIAGRAGQQQVTEGALVGQGEATLLTTVEQIDPMYVNFSQAVGELDLLKRAVGAGAVELNGPNKAKVEVMRPDGSPYGISGTLDFSDQTVDPATGAVNLRGIVSNPNHVLLPGMFVNVHVTIGELKHAWLVPQVAIQRDGQGAYVMVLGGDGKVAQKPVDTYVANGADMIVTGGLNDGDQVIVSGLMKVRPGAPAKAAAPQAAGGAPGAPGAAAGNKQGPAPQGNATPPAQGNPQPAKTGDEKKH
jgi:membrane fusion protein (multidrug efflux system)